ncbi:hypothetical protein C8R47DRAFT_666942 [Mycena vitilis]|nr:hypothetical protein C8R47DRAFT_666942 [Mycena vitilis]
MLSFRRTFVVNPEALAPGHPYSFDNSGRSCRVSFFEFRGTGPPSSSFGYAGDVYVDLTPSYHALYWRDRQGHGSGPWRKWSSLLLDKVPLYKYLTSHPWADDPQTSDLYLWVDPAGVTWTSRAEICASRAMMLQKGIAPIAPGEKNPRVEALVGEILARMIEEEESRTLPPIQDRRDRYSAPSPPHAGPSRSVGAQRGRSESAASQYSPPDALHARVQLPPLKHSPIAYIQSPALSPVRPSPSPIPRSTSYTPDRRRTTPIPDRRQPITAPGTLHRQPPAPYPGVGVASSSTSRANELPIHPQGHEPPPRSPINSNLGATEQELRDSFAWNEMQRAQYAEAHFKRELRLKNRELSKFKKKEKDVISMSFIYQKKERELMTALASVEQRSQAELEEQRKAVRAAQRQIEEAEQQTREAVRELQRVEEALAEARNEIKQLKSSKGFSSPFHGSRTSVDYIDVDQTEVEDGGMKDGTGRVSFSRSERPSRDRMG